MEFKCVVCVCVCVFCTKFCNAKNSKKIFFIVITGKQISFFNLFMLNSNPAKGSMFSFSTENSLKTTVLQSLDRFSCNQTFYL